MKTTEKALSRFLPVVFFIVLLAVGLILYDDYGGYTDELVEIQTAVINAKAIFAALPGLRSVQGLNLPIYNDFSQIPELITYRDRAYGTAVMFPTILVNQLPGVQLDLAQLLNLRRFYVFLNFYLALFVFYRFLKVRFGNPLIALTGILMLTLTPRFFAESFYNCKDILFFCWFLICFCSIGWYFLRKTRKALALFCFAFALTVNTRFIGVILLPVLLAFMMLDAVRFPAQRSRELRCMGVVLLATFACLYAVTPLLWGMNLEQIKSGLFSITNLPGIGESELFMGHLIPPRTVWYYVPVWMAITIPVLYLVFFAAEMLHLAKRWLSAKRFAISADTLQGFLFDSATGLMFWVMLAGICFSQVTLYHAWRHVYFIYGPLVYLSICGFVRLMEFPKKETGSLSFAKSFIIGVTLLSFLNTGVWVAKNHPLDFVYFNEIGRKYAADFSRDYWGVGSKSCLLYLASTVDKETISVAVNSDLTYGAAEYTMLRMPQPLRERFIPIWQTPNSDYLCFSYKNVKGNHFPYAGYEEIKSLDVDGYAVVGVYRKQSPSVFRSFPNEIPTGDFFVRMIK